MFRGCAYFFQIALLYSATSMAQSPLPGDAGPAVRAPAVAKDTNSSGQQGETPQNNPDPPERLHRAIDLPRQILRDQIGLWTSPTRIRLSDATFFVPLGGLTAGMIATDSDMSRHLSDNPKSLLRDRNISDYGAAGTIGLVDGAYVLGLTTHNEHLRETGFLGMESLLDSVVIAESLGYATGRERPIADGARGRFWHGGNSFPSEHAAVAWSAASIVAHEYPNPFVRLLAYGLATTITVSRVEAKEHFPSDALVGTALGWLVGEYVYRQQHNPRIEGRDWSIPSIRPERAGHWQAKNMGSAYVSLDSWVYPSFDRLIALGYVRTGFQDMRPWTRMECARLVIEAQDQINEDDLAQSAASELYHALQIEFRREEDLLGGGNNASIGLESVYSRSTQIAGQPLTDGYHFAQTEINDYGRPYEQGFNNVSGISGWAEDGPFAGYVRVEYQHAPESSALPLAARQAIAQQDFGPDVPLGVNPESFIPPASPVVSINQSHLLDAYIAMNLSDWQLSYGKQSLWWGPGRGGPMMFSDNADPINMFRINRVTPFRLPSFLGALGPMRLEFFLGQFSGYHFILNPSGVVGNWGQSLHPQPIIHGERLSFKPTENLEIGLSRTTDYGGPGYPLTVHSFLRSVFSTSNALAGSPNKPGDRRSGLDLSYRIPGLRNGLTFYCDGFVEDEISPLVGPDVAARTGGLYIPRVPRLPKLDFRLEGVYTDLPSGGTKRPGFFYYDSTWITGYQNSGNLLGSWIGRGGQGAQAWSSYRFTPKDKLELSYRHQKVSNQFVPDGGTLADADLRADFWMGSLFSLSASVQYEAWTFPVIASNRRRDVATMVQLAVWPRPGASKAAASD